MITWKSHNAVLYLVLKELKSEKEFHQCLCVNQKWFKRPQPLLYEKIKIEYLHDDTQENSLTNNLFNSKYKPGQFVEIEYDDGLPSASYVSTLDPNWRIDDRLCLLMVDCPNAYIPEFYDEFDNFILGYFPAALRKAENI
jgi:hypothetical protein